MTSTRAGGSTHPHVTHREPSADPIRADPDRCGSPLRHVTASVTAQRTGTGQRQQTQCAGCRDPCVCVCVCVETTTRSQRALSSPLTSTQDRLCGQLLYCCHHMDAHTHRRTPSAGLRRPPTRARSSTFSRSGSLSLSLGRCAAHTRGNLRTRTTDGSLRRHRSVLPGDGVGVNGLGR